MKTDSNCKKLKQSCSKLKKKKKCSKPLKDSIGSSKTAKKCKKALKGNMDGKVGSFCLQTCDLCGKFKIYIRVSGMQNDFQRNKSV